ncbi:uncharacterized protein UDID_18359 [Ustilago sp. UG-2017a]|nr:uncharacterized protein UDID_18359 [Ustilago sp. UG-2017a]
MSVSSKSKKAIEAQMTNFLELTQSHQHDPEVCALDVVNRTRRGGTRNVVDIPGSGKLDFMQTMQMFARSTWNGLRQKSSHPSNRTGARPLTSAGLQKSEEDGRIESRSKTL